MDILQFLKYSWQTIIKIDPKDLSEVIRNYATCVAYVVGGLWVYFTFIRKREKYPSLDVNHRVISKRVNNEKIFLKVVVDFFNKGNTVVCLEKRLIRIQKMLPWTMEELNKIDTFKTRTKQEDAEVEWPLLGEVDLSGKDYQHEIEPGESDEFHADFLIDSGIESIVIYSYFKNQTKRGREIGWNKTTTYDIK